MRMGTSEFLEPTEVKAPVATGLCAGTSVMTLAGEMPIAHLSVGDKVITRDCGMAVVKDIIVKTMKFAPIRIKAGSLGHTRPDRDMIVSPDAQLYIRDWRAEALFGKPAATVPAGRLVDGEFLAQQDPKEMTVYEIIFDREHIIYADGVEMITGAKA